VVVVVLVPRVRGRRGRRARLARLPLRAVALEVADEAQAQRVLQVESLDADQVARHFGRTLAEPDQPVVHRQRRRVGGRGAVAAGRHCSEQTHTAGVSAPILSVFPALIVHSELKSMHPGFPVAFIFLSTS